MSACTDEAWERTLMAIFAVDAASVAMNPNPSPTIPPMTTDMTSWNKQQSQYEISVGKHSNPPEMKKRVVDCRLSESAEECPKHAGRALFFERSWGISGCGRGKDGAGT